MYQSLLVTLKDSNNYVKNPITVVMFFESYTKYSVMRNSLSEVGKCHLNSIEFSFTDLPNFCQGLNSFTGLFDIRFCAMRIRFRRMKYLCG